MGKGDVKTRRGKLWNKSFGKTRPQAKAAAGARKTTSAA